MTERNSAALGGSKKFSTKSIRPPSKIATMTALATLPGITAELPKLKALGSTGDLVVAGLSRAPWWTMAMTSADYQAIDPRFGTMADFDQRRWPLPKISGSKW